VDGFSVLLEPREPDRFILGEPIVVGLDLRRARPTRAPRRGGTCRRTVSDAASGWAEHG